MELMILLFFLSFDNSTGYPQTDYPLQDSVTCGRFTHKTVHVNENTASVFTTRSDTRLCIVKYRLTGGCTKLRLYCGRRFWLENKDPVRCLRGDSFYVKIAAGKPNVYCNTERPTKKYPAVGSGDMKIWYKATPKKRLPNKGVTCLVECQK